MQDRTLAKSQILHFRRWGFLVLPQALDTREVATLLTILRCGKSTRKSGQPLDRHKKSRAWQQLVRHAAFVTPIAQLLGGTPCVVQSMTAFKPPAQPGIPPQNGVALHQDQQYIKTEPAGMIACWIALNDTDAGNGGLMLVPGSHRHGLRDGRGRGAHHGHTILQHMRDRKGREWNEYADTSDIAVTADRAVTLAVPAGGAVLFDGFLVHGSRSNAAPDRERLALAIHYIRDGTWVFRKDLNPPYRVRRPVRTLRLALTPKLSGKAKRPGNQAG